jgi:aspartokinase
VSATRAQFRAEMQAARERLYEAGVTDQMRRIAEGGYDDVQEAMADLEPEPREHPVTDDELAHAIEQLRTDAADTRAFVAAHGEAWSDPTRARWLAYADAMEARYWSLVEVNE